MRLFLFLCISCAYLFANAHIFLLHRISDNRYLSTSTPVKVLEEEFQYLKNHNYKVVKTSEIIKKINNKEKIPNNWVAFEIDDAYESFYKNGLPLFKKYNYPFTLSVYVEAVEKKYNDFMTWKQIKDSSKYGDISLHSYGHKHLIHLSKKDLIADTRKAYKEFVKKLGIKPVSYVYPYGEYNEEVKNTLKEFDFSYIANQNIGDVNLKTDIYDVNRIALTGNKSDIKNKIKYKTLEVDWIEPKRFPKDGVLKKVLAKVDPSIKNMKLYISKYGWQDIKVNNGIIDLNINKKLILNRTRIILGTSFYNLNVKILIK